ncbi:MAG: S8 family peptidase [Acidimicrobiia bacterium]
MRGGPPNRTLISLVAVGTLAIGSLGATATAGAVAAADRAPVPAPRLADDRLIVTLAPGTSSDAGVAIADQAGARLEARAGDTLILDPSPSIHASSSLSSDPQVQTVEPNYALHAAVAPNDPLYPDQYGLFDTQPGGIRAETGWNGTKGSRDVVVGVLDSGITTNHPDLAQNMWTNRTGVNGCGYGTHGWDAFAHTCRPVDDAGHGTHVSGILGAVGNNGKGVTGVAQRVSLMSLKMLDHNGDGSVASAVGAIEFGLSAKAAGVDIRVFQASWDSSTYSAAIHNAIERANSAGILFVAAAGNGLDNDGIPRNLDTPGNDTYPCEDASPNVICVGASTPTGQLANFSNFGSTAVDLVAPGFRIESTVPRGLVRGCDPASDYCLFDGTSMATPMVSGAAVDIVTAEPNLSVSALKSRILDTVDQQSALVGKVATDGRLDVCKALPNCNGQPQVAPTRPTNFRAQARDGSAKLRWGLPDSNGNSFTISSYEVEGPNGVTSLPLTATKLTLTGLTNNTTVTVRVRAIGSGGTGPWATKKIRPYAGGYVVEGSGIADPVGVGGKSPSPISDGPSFPTGLARGIAIVPEGTGGYILDGFGGLHRFRIGSTSPMPPTATGGPYWLGWDIARGVATSTNGGGFVVDGYGGLHPFGAGPGAPPGAAHDGPSWSGFDIARGVTLNSDASGGYVADGYGGIHRFRVGSGGALPPNTTGGPYWPGWNIVRGIALVPGTSGGWMLDGFGGLHRFGAGGPAPAAPSSAPYWRGQDRARGLGL